jgi:hypothetical protein
LRCSREDMAAGAMLGFVAAKGCLRCCFFGVWRLLCGNSSRGRFEDGIGKSDDKGSLRDLRECVVVGEQGALSMSDAVATSLIQPSMANSDMTVDNNGIDSLAEK